MIKKQEAPSFKEAKLKDKTTTLIQHPELVTHTVKEKYETIRTTIEQVSEDVSFVAGKVEKLKETTPQVMEIVNDTKKHLRRSMVMNRNK